MVVMPINVLIQEVIDEKLEGKLSHYKEFADIYNIIFHDQRFKSKELVMSVQGVVRTLLEKSKYLPDRLQAEAEQLIKILAVYRLYQTADKQGVSSEVLSVILKPDVNKDNDNKNYKIKVELILEKLRKITDGQFINKTEDGYYHLDLIHTIDYEQIIKEKARTITITAVDKLLFNIIKKDLQLKTVSINNNLNLLEDFCLWPDKNSYRCGYIIYDMINSGDGKGKIIQEITNIKEKGDFRLIIISPFKSAADIKSTDTTVIINLKDEVGLYDLTARLQAIYLLEEGNNYNQEILQRKIKQIQKQLQQKLFQIFMQAEINQAGKVFTTSEVIDYQLEETDIRTLVDSLKIVLFNKIFSNNYDKHPEFTEPVRADNIIKKTEDAIRCLIDGEETVNSGHSWQLLTDLHLLDSQGYSDSTCKYCQMIMYRLRQAKEGKLELEDVLKILQKQPLGLEQEFAYLILTVLALNGEINLIMENGLQVNGSEFQKFLGVELNKLFTSVMEKFAQIKAISLADDIPVEKISPLLEILNLDPDLIIDKQNRPHLVRQFEDLIAGIEEHINNIDEQLQNLKQRNRRNQHLIDLSLLIQKREGLADIPLEQFSRVDKVPDLKRLVFSKRELEKIEIGFRLLRNLGQFLQYFTVDICEDYFYLQKSWKLIDENRVYFNKSDIECLQEMASQCDELLKGALSFLDQGKLTLLQEKLSVYRQQYQTIYYNSHQKIVGAKRNWCQLQYGKNILKLRELEKFTVVCGVKDSEIEHLQHLFTVIEDIKCSSLNKDEIESSYKCPHCNFPKYEPENEQVAEERELPGYILKRIEQISTDIADNIIKEIGNVSDNIDDLSDEEKELMREILEKENMPEVIDKKVISAFNHLLASLKIIEITPCDLIELLFDNTDVVTYDTLTERTAELPLKLLSNNLGTDKQYIRIKLDKK